MAKTYTVQSAIDVVSKMGKGLPISSIDETVADMVSSKMWSAHPWKDATTTIAPAITMVDGDQDYTAPSNIMRLLKLRLVRTDTTPDEFVELDIEQTLEPELVKRSFRNIRKASFEAGIGKIRLASAISVPSGVTLELQGEYQINHTKLTSLANGLWFDDMWLQVYCEGLLWWIYRLGDDDRAADQYKVFERELEKMKAAEDLAGVENLFPDDTLAPGKDSWNAGIFGAY